jgi:hypothetical protein
LGINAAVGGADIVPAILDWQLVRHWQQPVKAGCSMQPCSTSSTGKTTCRRD